MENENYGDEHSPADTLEFILGRLAGFYEIYHFGPRQEVLDTLKQLEESPDDHTHYFEKMLADEEVVYHKPEAHESTGHTIQLMAIHAALAHCAEARRPGRSRDHQWYHTTWAMSYAGYLRGTIPGHQTGYRASIRHRAAKGASARHKENREMKKEAFEWLSANMGKFKSMDEAAEAMRGVVPVTFRTSRDWVGHWNKLAKEQKK